MLHSRSWCIRTSPRAAVDSSRVKSAEKQSVEEASPLGRIESRKLSTFSPCQIVTESVLKWRGSTSLSVEVLKCLGSMNTNFTLEDCCASHLPASSHVISRRFPHREPATTKKWAAEKRAAACGTVAAQLRKLVPNKHRMYYIYAWSIASATLPNYGISGWGILKSYHQTIYLIWVLCFRLHIGRSACCFVVLWSQWDRDEHFMSPLLKIGSFLEVMQACILGVNMHKNLMW